MLKVTRRTVPMVHYLYFQFQFNFDRNNRMSHFISLQFAMRLKDMFSAF